MFDALANATVNMNDVVNVAVKIRVHHRHRALMLNAVWYMNHVAKLVKNSDKPKRIFNVKTFNVFFRSTAAETVKNKVNRIKPILELGGPRTLDWEAFRTLEQESFSFTSQISVVEGFLRIVIFSTICSTVATIPISEATSMTIQG